MQILLKTDNPLDFSGDALILPCDAELTFNKPIATDPNYPKFLTTDKKSLHKQIFEKAGKDLTREASVIGFTEIGFAAITKGYNLKIKNIIFMPITDHENPQDIMDNITLHHALRSAFMLAQLYNLKSIAIPLFNLKKLKDNAVEDITLSLLKDFENSIEEVTMYKK